MFARGTLERRKLREQKGRLGLGASFRKGVERGGLGGGEAPVPYVGADEVNEETPLLLSTPSHRHLAINTSNHMDLDSAQEDEASQLSREIEMVFGAWPGRLANHNVGIIQSFGLIY